MFTMLKFRTLRPDAETRLGPYLEGRARPPHAIGNDAARPSAPSRSARRAPAVLERAPRRHELRRAAADPSSLLRGARGRAARVLAAAGRPARADRPCAGEAKPRVVVGGEARARSRMDRRQVGTPVFANARVDGLARVAAVARRQSPDVAPRARGRGECGASRRPRSRRRDAARPRLAPPHAEARAGLVGRPASALRSRSGRRPAVHGTCPLGSCRGRESAPPCPPGSRRPRQAPRVVRARPPPREFAHSPLRPLLRCPPRGRRA